MGMYTDKTLAKCEEIRDKLIQKGYGCKVWHMAGGFITVRIARFVRPDGSNFWAETLKDLKLERIKCQTIK